MPYITQDDMVDAFGEQELIQLTDRSNADVIDATVLQKALDYAEDLIDAQIPRAIRPDKTKLVTALAADIARWRLYDIEAPDHVQKRYDEAMKLLRDAAAGKASLGVNETTGEEMVTAGGVKNHVPGRTFNDQTFDCY